MALVRILVDGYNLIHALERGCKSGGRPSPNRFHYWPKLPAGAPCHSEMARDALVELLANYQDACGTPVTIFFDGHGRRKTRPQNEAGRPVEVLFSSAGQTADDLIERAAARFQPYGEVLVVTDDFAERETVSGFGGSVTGCDNFMRLIQNALADLREKLNNHNRSERSHFSRSR